MATIPTQEIDVRYERASELHLQGFFNEAYALYDEILEDRPNDIPVRITYAHMKWKEGQLDEAELRFKSVVSEMPQHIKSRQWLGQLYWHMGQREKAKEQFEALHELDFKREDVLHSAKISLGKIALQEEDWRKARKHFRLLKAEGNRGDAGTGRRGLHYLDYMMQLDDWGRVDTPLLYIHFSPELKDMRDSEVRKRYANELQSWLEVQIAGLKIRRPDPWHVYVYQDDEECGFITGRKSAHGWDTNWWVSHVATTSGVDPRRTLAMQLAVRAGGNRPSSKCLVEGFAAWIAGVHPAPHEPAAKLLKDGRLPTIVSLHKSIRRPYQYEVGMSFVKFLIDRYGLDKFLVLWRKYPTLADAPQFKINNTKSIEWARVFNQLFREAFGEDFAPVTKAWRDSLGG